MAKSVPKSSISPIQSRQLWIEAGLKVLASKGPDGLRIDVLCKNLKLTKGSFYHHFADRQDYLKALLDDWKTTSTERIFALSNQEATPDARFNRISRLVETIDHGLETALRLWAAFDPTIRAAVTRVDRQRITYLLKVVESMAPDRQTAKFVVELGYSSFIGAQITGKVQLNPAWHARFLQILEFGVAASSAKGRIAPVASPRRVA